MIEPVLEVDELLLRRGNRTLCDGLTFSLMPGVTLSLMGRSGSGKSSLLMAVLGLGRIDGGEIVVDGVSIATAQSREIVRLRRTQIGTLFQTGELLTELTIRENLQITGLLRGMPKATILSEAKRLLHRMNIGDIDVPVGLLSGGEYQRAAIARALLGSPKLVLADEPTGSLDLVNRDAVVGLLVEQAKWLGSALIIVTHDPEVAATTDIQLALTEDQRRR